jgi:hypothetical protein
MSKLTFLLADLVCTHLQGRWGCEKENPNPCHALPLKIQTWGVVEIGVSCKARKGTRSFSIVMKCSRIEEGTFEKMYKGRQKACGLTMALKEM